MYPLNKYKFYVAGRKVIAVSTYAGKNVRGVAICDPNDSFDEDTGKAIAAARCNENIAIKREKRARKKLEAAQAQLDKANQHYHDMKVYLTDATQAMINAHNVVNDLIGKPPFII